MASRGMLMRDMVGGSDGFVDELGAGVEVEVW
jgi:hypothetical protein